jgi:predicted protein tyrosine phosphatase
MSRIIVSSLKLMVEAGIAHRASHLISLMGPEHPVHRPGFIARDRHLMLGVNDIAFKGTGKLIGPSEQHIAAIIEFAKQWQREASDKPLLIHCWLGQSRSPAAALIAALTANPKIDDFKLAQALRAASPFANPNKRMVELADSVIQRNGKLIEACKAIGHGKKADLSPPFILDLDQLSA